MPQSGELLESRPVLSEGERKSGRNSALEVLRILAMLSIVSSHYFTHGGTDIASLISAGYRFNAWYLQATRLGGMGVIVFVMLFGYFGVRSGFTWEKLAKMVLQVFTYSAVIYAVFVLTGARSFRLAELIKVLLPTIFCQYWFFTAYIALFILSPYLNRAILRAEQKHLQTFILTMLVLWSVIPTVTLSLGDMYGATLPQFLLFYALGAYLRLYPGHKWNTKKAGLLLALGSYFLMLVSATVLDYFGRYSDFIWEQTTFFFGRPSILAIAGAFGLLVCFANIKPFYKPRINFIASLTFGVYLLHDNEYIRPFLWESLLKNAKWAETPYLIPHQICSVLGVFLVGLLVEFLRQKLIEPLYRKPLHRWFEKRKAKESAV